MLRKHSRFISIALLPLSTYVAAHTTELDTVVVSSAGQQSIYDVAQPVTIIGKEEIDANAGATLGTLLENTPGVANASYGAGVGRPVVRGMSGSRVKILQNGSDSADISAMSSDHSPMAEASAAEQVEIIYGPSTLLYGGGAIGGVVNLIDRRIHEQPASGLSGDVAARYSSVDNGYSTDALLDMGKGNWVLHIDGFNREAGNYKSGNRGTIPHDYNHGRIENSASEGSGGAIALSWADGEHGFIGGSISTLKYQYGVPYIEENHQGHNHAHEEETHLQVAPKQTRYELKGALRPDLNGSFGWIDEWRTELTFTDYEHAELDHHDIMGFFEQDSFELQSRIRHQLMGGWQGSFGIQVKHQKFSMQHLHDHAHDDPNHSHTHGLESSNGYLFSHGTAMPNTSTKQFGIFIVEQRDWLAGTLELGARLDQVLIDSNPDNIDEDWHQDLAYYKQKEFMLLTLSAATTWVITDTQRWGFSLARVERAPEASELLWNGEHHATHSYQLDNPSLTEETAYTFDINWLFENENNKVRLAGYYYHFNDYIYNDLKDFEHDHNPVYRYEQHNARFLGAEVSWQHNFTDNWHFDMSADFVDARLTSGEYLPRTPPASMLIALNYEHAGWDLRVESKLVSEQHASANNEENTNGFVLFNAYAGYRMNMSHGDVLWHLAAQNLTDEYATNHVSYLKQAAPLPGRNIQAGVRWRF